MDKDEYSSYSSTFTKSYTSSWHNFKLNDAQKPKPFIENEFTKKAEKLYMNESSKDSTSCGCVVV